MEISIVYSNNKVEQQFYVIEQEWFDEYLEVKLLIPQDDEKSKPSDKWVALTIEEQEYFLERWCGLKWIEKLKKDGKLCTTESPIYESFLRNDGKLILMPSQGGEHNVSTKIVK